MHRLFVAAALILAGSACGTGNAVEGSGSGRQRNYQVGAFDRVELAGHYDVRVTVGGAQSVRA